ncbi:MAG TPA: Crp/Fnr family transcriptional regulator, partial [Sphingomonadaceae bacterium]|nr:Crp/Fnr family transcriptional regulator [Sphingomonadaceae bacterium]
CANVVSGVLQMTTATSDGREQIVGLLFPGDFVGQPFATEASLTFAALTDAELCVYPRTAFVSLLSEHGALERALFHRTMDALDEARSRMLTLGRRSAGEKVAGLLVELSERLPHDADDTGADSFELPLSRAQIADVLGLTIETVSRQMTKLRDAGAIAIARRRRIAILDLDRLMERADIPHA